MLDSWPKLLTELKRSNYPARSIKSLQGGKHIFFLDLSELKLKFSHKTPLIWIPERIVGFKSDRAQFEDICSLAHANGAMSQGCIVLFDAPGDSLKSLTKGWANYPIIVFDSNDQADICKNLPHRDVMLERICQQLSISSLAPYSYGQAVAGSQFFGRQTEFTKLLHNNESSFAITSGRRLGKTCLITELKRRLTEDDDDEKDLIYYDCSLIQNLTQLLEALVGETDLKRLAGIYRSGNPSIQFSHLLRTRHRSRGKKITFFLDEFDRLLENLERVKEHTTLLYLLRATISAGDCRYVVAGFNKLQEAIRKRDSPLYLGLESIELKPFHVRETEEAVMRPMTSLKVRVEHERTIVSRIHSATRGHPLFVQFMCSQLINLLDQQEYLTARSRPVLKLEHLEEVSASSEFTTFISDTFLYNAETQEKLIIYSILNHFGAQKNYFTQEEIRQALEKAGTRLSPEQIERRCSSLVSSAVLDTEGRGYCFAIRALPDAINTRFHGFDHLLSQTLEDFNK